MARRKRAKKELWLGAATLGAALALLLVVAFGLLGGELPFSSQPPLVKNPYTQADFTDADGYRVCTAAETIRGIDVSEHQGDIDWQAVKDSGVEFAIIRVGYRGYQSGDLFADENCQQNYEGAKAAGLKVGAYLFSQAVTVEEAQEEADFFLQCIAGWDLDLWAVYDWEYVSAEARTANVDKRTLTDCTKTFLDAVTLAGYQPMVYFNRSQSENRLYMEELTHYDFWLAMYHDPIETFDYRMDMWQYTCTGSVPGIGGNVDINLWFPE